MKSWIISWDTGYGKSHEEIEADTYDEAMEIAYQYWRGEVEANADYDVIGEATDDLREEYL